MRPSSTAMTRDGTNRLHWYSWVFLTLDIAVFHLSASQSKTVPEVILEGFEGIIIGDSRSSWNDVGTEVQRCLLHYFRDMDCTLKENQSPEFKSFFKKLHSILKSSIKPWIPHGKRGSTVPERIVNNLPKRIDKLTFGKYKDPDCTQYVKRLKRERNQLFTFLTHDGIPYHNNAA